MKSIYDAIPGSADASSTIGSGFYTFPCSSAPDSISFELGGSSFTVSADTFNLGTASSDPDSCVGGIMAENSFGTSLFSVLLTDLSVTNAFRPIGFWILGDVFLRNVYTGKHPLCAYGLSLKALSNSL